MSTRVDLIQSIQDKHQIIPAGTRGVTLSDGEAKRLIDRGVARPAKSGKPVAVGGDPTKGDA